MEVEKKWACLVAASLNRLDDCGTSSLGLTETSLVGSAGVNRVRKF